MTDNKEKVLDQDAELDLEETGDKIVGGTSSPAIEEFEVIGFDINLGEDGKAHAFQNYFDKS